MSKEHSKVHEKNEGTEKAGEAHPPSHKTPPTSPAQAKGPTALPGGCLSWGCKHSASRFNFCDNHFDHFKFGLIKKTGEPVSDYEKKIEHFMAHKAKKGAHKVA